MCLFTHSTAAHSFGAGGGPGMKGTEAYKPRACEHARGSAAIPTAAHTVKGSPG